MIVDAGTARPSVERRVDVLSYVRRLDWLLLLAVGALVAYGLWAVAGITRFDVTGDENYYVVRQAIAAALGGIGLVVALAIDPDAYRRHWRTIYGGTVALMVLVFALAEATRGSKRWIELGPFQFQPSEFGKLLFVLAIAGFLAERARRIGDWRTILGAVALGCGPLLLVFAQPDIGTSLVYAAALAAVLFVAGARWTHLAALAAVGVLLVVSVLWLLPSAGVEVLKPYQMKRITGFANPDQDPDGLTYNVTQSITAIGAGGLDGRGVDGATQTRLDYLPEHATDFVFASFSLTRASSSRGSNGLAT